jgi:hypothetical protein
VRTEISPRAWVVGLALLCAAVALPARAQTEEDGWAPPVAEGDRPTSGDMSLLSGRTLGNGEVVLAAALGWPGFWAHVELAPSATFNIGIRLAVLYGSPAMGLAVGGGGEASVPMRIRLWGERDTDIALRLTPRAAVGEGVLFGQTATFGGDLAWMARLDAEAVLGFHPDPRITFIFAVGGGGGVSHVVNTNVEGIGRVVGSLGIEGLLARDTMMFAEVNLGVGIARDTPGIPVYPDRFVLGLSLGIAYLL